MPLIPEPGILPSKFDGVFFTMFNGNERVLCLVDYAALNDLAARNNISRDPVATFRAFRSKIENIASAKFDAIKQDVVDVLRLNGEDFNF